MLVVSFTIWYKKIQATARAGAIVRAMEEHALRAQYSFRTRLIRVCCWSEAGTHVWNILIRFDVVCDWINALLVKKKGTEVAVMSGVANPIGSAPALTALNNFNPLNWKK